MIYTNLKMVDATMHGLFESSRLKSTDCGKILDLIVRDSSDKVIDVDNGVALRALANTGDGLQTKYATIAGVGDKVYIAGTPALIKDAHTQAQAQPYNFTNKAGQPLKAYEVLGDEAEVFAVANYQFTDAKVPAVGDYVVVSGDGMWVAEASEPSASTYGFIGRVHSIATGTFSTTVRIECIQNVQL